MQPNAVCRMLSLFLVILIPVVSFLPLTTLHAQNATPVTISLAVPPFAQDIFNDKFMSDFQAVHPGIKISLVNESSALPSAAQSLQNHFDALQKYVSSADVVYVDANRISAE